jgi:hypothetical protein
MIFQKTPLLNYIHHFQCKHFYAKINVIEDRIELSSNAINKN